VAVPAGSTLYQASPSQPCRWIQLIRICAVEVATSIEMEPEPRDRGVISDLDFELCLEPIYNWFEAYFLMRGMNGRKSSSH